MDPGLTGFDFFFLIEWYTVQIFQVLYNVTMILIVSLRSCLFGTLRKMFSFKTRIVHFCLQAIREWENCALLPYLAQTKALLPYLLQDIFRAGAKPQSWAEKTRMNKIGSYTPPRKLRTNLPWKCSIFSFLPWQACFPALRPGLSDSYPSPATPNSKGELELEKRNKRHSFIHPVYLSFLQHTFIECPGFKPRW